MQQVPTSTINSDAFVRAVEAIYRASAEPSHWHHALQAIADVTGDIGANLVYARDDGSFGVIESPALTHMLPEFNRAWSDRDIRAIRCRERGYFRSRDLVTDRDILT